MLEQLNAQLTNQNHLLPPPYLPLFLALSVPILLLAQSPSHAPIHSPLKVLAASEVLYNNIGHAVCAAGDKSGSNCSKELTEWNKVNFQMGGVTLAGQLDVNEVSAAEQKHLQEAGIGVPALQKAPCSLQVALLPFGDKDEPLLFKGQPCSPSNGSHQYP